MLLRLRMGVRGFWWLGTGAKLTKLKLPQLSSLVEWSPDIHFTKPNKAQGKTATKEEGLKEWFFLRICFLFRFLFLSVL